jgi:hypothetical protein
MAVLPFRPTPFFRDKNADLVVALPAQPAEGEDHVTGGAYGERQPVADVN